MKIYNNTREIRMVVHEKYLSWWTRNIYGSAQEIFMIVHKKYL